MHLSTSTIENSYLKTLKKLCKNTDDILSYRINVKKNQVSKKTPLKYKTQKGVNIFFIFSKNQ